MAAPSSPEHGVGSTPSLTCGQTQECLQLRPLDCGFPWQAGLQREEAMPTAAPAVLRATLGLCLCSDRPVPARDPSPKFATGPLTPNQGNRGTRHFCGVCGVFRPHPWGCPAHEKQPDMMSCHPSPQTVAPSLCPGVPGLPLRCLPLLFTPAVHQARAHSHTNEAGKLVGDAANPPSVSSALSFPGATSLC